MRSFSNVSLPCQGRATYKVSLNDYYPLPELRGGILDLRDATYGPLEQEHVQDWGLMSLLARMIIFQMRLAEWGLPTNPSGSLEFMEKYKEPTMLF